MTTYTNAFESALSHAMLYEVGGWWKLTPEVQAGLCDTAAQKRAVGYANDPTDAGGETKFGVAKNDNPDLDILGLDWDGAKAVYYERYWIPGACDKLSPRLSVLHFDGCINNGDKRAEMFLQKAVGATQDGSIGPVTLALVNAANELDICSKVCDMREQFYHDIVSAKPSQVKFLAGWLRRISEIKAFVLDQNSSFE